MSPVRIADIVAALQGGPLSVGAVVDDLDARTTDGWDPDFGAAMAFAVGQGRVRFTGNCTCDLEHNEGCEIEAA